MANYYDAYDDGHEDGAREGFASGAAEGYTKGHAEGAQSGYAKGYEEGVAAGGVPAEYAGQTVCMTDNGVFESRIDVFYAPNATGPGSSGSLILRGDLVAGTRLCNLPKLQNADSNVKFDGVGVSYGETDGDEKFSTTFQLPSVKEVGDKTFINLGFTSPEPVAYYPPRIYLDRITADATLTVEAWSGMVSGQFKHWSELHLPCINFSDLQRCGQFGRSEDFLYKQGTSGTETVNFTYTPGNWGTRTGIDSIAFSGCRADVFLPSCTGDEVSRTMLAGEAIYGQYEQRAYLGLVADSNITASCGDYYTVPFRPNS